MDSPTESQFDTWTTPQCSFAIEYSLRVLDDIRLAVMDAFYSLPRGGAEIGGILLGSYDMRRVRIEDYAALDCEHAYGPSFTLSDRDYTKLEELLTIARRSGAGLTPVGWYHSHTRSEVFFSDADIAIHKRFFPESRQIGLVLKPHVFEPTRAGFFFRDAIGAIHGASSYREFMLGPQTSASAAAPAAVPLMMDRPPIDIPVQPAPKPLAIPQPIAEPKPIPAPKPASAPAPDAAEVKPPDFLAVQPPATGRWRWALPIVAVAALAVGGYQTRSAWLPQVQSATAQLAAKPAPPLPQPKPAPLPVTLGLTTVDQNGQLHIAWDRNASALRTDATGMLSITDGAEPLVIPLDQAHLQTGSFTYGRQSGRVDVSLAVQTPDGRTVREVSTYVGQPPAKPVRVEDGSVRKQRDDLAKEAAKLKSDLKKQAERTKNLENSMDQMRLELIRQQRTRMQNMSPDAPKGPAKQP